MVRRVIGTTRSYACVTQAGLTRLGSNVMCTSRVVLWVRARRATTASLFPWRGLVTGQHRVERCPVKPIPIAGAQLCPWNARRVLYQKVGNFVGSVISPCHANVYLHYVLDLWFEKRAKQDLQGEAYLTRFVDDFVVAFQYKRDAEDFDRTLTHRMEKFGLKLAPDKTRMLLFGRFARERAASYGGKPGTFEFLGFKHVCGVDAKGKFAVIRIPSEKSCRNFLDRTYAWLQQHRHWRRRDHQRHLATQLKGFYQYFALNRCVPKLERVKYHVEKQWRHAIKRQSQRHRVFWSYLRSRSWFQLPQPKVLHPGF